MTNSSNEDKKSYFGVGVACSLRYFYDMQESNFHQFRAGGFKRGIENFTTKQR